MSRIVTTTADAKGERNSNRRSGRCSIGIHGRSSPRSTTDDSVSAEAAASSFPIGTYAKELEDPFLGRVRLTWTFAGDGRYAEVPEALDGQRIDAPVVRGTFAVKAGTLTIATDYPPGWGTSHHTWRRDGTLLWTTFVTSDVEGDAEWFEMLDAQPWVRLE